MKVGFRTAVAALLDRLLQLRNRLSVVAPLGRCESKVCKSFYFRLQLILPLKGLEPLAINSCITRICLCQSTHEVVQRLCLAWIDLDCLLPGCNGVFRSAQLLIALTQQKVCICVPRLNR